MPMWFDVTAVVVLFIAAVGMTVAIVGIVRASDRALYAGGLLIAVPVVGFVALAIATAAIMALQGV